MVTCSFSFRGMDALSWEITLLMVFVSPLKTVLSKRKEFALHPMGGNSEF